MSAIVDPVLMVDSVLMVLIAMFAVVLQDLRVFIAKTI